MITIIEVIYSTIIWIGFLFTGLDMFIIPAPFKVASTWTFFGDWSFSNNKPVPFVEPFLSFQLGAPVNGNSLLELLVIIGFPSLVAILIYQLLRRGTSCSLKRSVTDDLGSGDLATTKQILQWTKAYDENDTRLKVENLQGCNRIALRTGELIIPSTQRNKHMLIITKNGSDKTAKLILPILYSDCMSKTRSTIAIDTQQAFGEKIASMTQKYNPEKKIILFNPLDTVRSASWNILSKIHDHTDASMISNTIIMATDDPTSRCDDPFLRDHSLSLLKSLMNGLLNDPNEALSIPRIHELVQSGIAELCNWINEHPDALKTSRSFVELATSGSQNADAIISELAIRLAAWDLSAIRATTAQAELDVECLIKEPTLMILEFRESELKIVRPMANVIVFELLRFLTKRAESEPGRSLPRPVGMVIDEFVHGLGTLPDIHVKLDILRRRNVSIVAAVESTQQIKEHYGEDADSVLAGFGNKIFMPALDLVDAEYASKESGQMKIQYFKTVSRGLLRPAFPFDEFLPGLNDRTQKVVLQRPVLTPDEIGQPVNNIDTFLLTNTPVFQGFLTPFYKDPLMLKRLTEFGLGL